MVELPRTVLGIPTYLVSWDPWDSMPVDPGHLVSRDPWDSMPGGTTQDCYGYPGILSIFGSMGLHAW